ncbi:DUF1292 domain-containing protein [Thermoactinomyces sp. DSM 45892]|uniref:DUF1292 domain-containing protein n=1 Tax=Thermoactinomyces sp. DSM 45892 TaxID=1882753 RepID=UPI00089B3742|nr:DUF1292 domain-containing protein [Thermoactinomyces sp. DSM 45892]SDZ32092.1 Uncharacterized protein YrzB, UPF0473 family [Thermoactinomyces sp. DSM 45892]
MSDQEQPIVLGDNEDFIPIITEDGEELLCEKILEHENPETGRKYVFLVPVSESDDDEVQDVFPFRYLESEDGFELQALETDEEWDEVEEVFNALMESLPEDED